MEEISRGLSSNVVLKGESATRLGKIARVFIQADLENLQGWRWHNLFGQPVAVFDCPHSEEGSRCIQVLLFLFTPVVSHPFAMHHCEKPSSISLMTDLLVGAGRLLLSLLEALSSPG